MADVETPIENSNFVNLVGPTGELGSVPPDQVSNYLNVGYKQATPEDLQGYVEQQTYGTVPQQIIGAGEQVLAGATAGLSNLAATKLGLTTPEAQKARERQLGDLGTIAAQGAGILGSTFLLPGAGIVGALEKAGQATVEAVGLGAAKSTAAKIGSAALKGATENALYQASVEGVEALQGNPDETIGTAAANIGLAAILGGALTGGVGAVHPLWRATKEAELSKTLKAITDRVGGVENSAISATEDAALRAGVPLSAEAKAIISNDPLLNDLAQPLQDSQSKSGKGFQEAVKESKTKMTDAILETVGRSADDVDALAEFSAAKSGADLQQRLSSKIEKMYEPIAKDYEKISNKYSKAEFNWGDRGVLENNIAELAANEGWSVRASSPEATFINKALKEIKDITNLDQLRLFGDSLSKEAVGMNRFDISRSVGRLFDDAEEAFVRTRLAKDAPELLAKHEAVTQSYKELKTVINELNARLRAGSSKGVKTFLYKLNDMTPEQVLSRLSQRNDAGFIDLLNKYFPDIQKSINDHHISSLLKSSSGKLGEGIDPTKFLKKMNDLTPELRDSLFSPQQKARMGAISELWSGVNKLPRNYSNTAATLDRLWKYKTTAAFAALAELLGKSPLVGGMIGHISELVGRDAPDAARLGLIKFLGSNKPISASGLKTAIDFIDATIKGENLTAKAVKAVFKSGQLVLPQAAIPTEKDRKNLDKILKSYQANPDQLMDLGGDLPHYMEQEGIAHAAYANNAVQVLNSMRPEVPKNSPLDSDGKPSKAKEYEYNRALDLAQQPLMALKYLNDGTLNAKDVQLLNMIHPAFALKVQGKLNDEMAKVISKGGKIPYKQRMGLSMLMAQPLDSTLTPASIQAAQLAVPAPQQQQPAQPRQAPSKLGNVSSSMMTPDQARQKHRMGRF